MNAIGKTPSSNVHAPGSQLQMLFWRFVAPALLGLIFAASLRAAVSDDQWIFIDHTHLTDEGYDLVARLIIDSTQ